MSILNFYYTLQPINTTWNDELIELTAKVHPSF